MFKRLVYDEKIRVWTNQPVNRDKEEEIYECIDDLLSDLKNAIREKYPELEVV